MRALGGGRLALWLLAAATTQVAGQWSVTLEAGVGRFSGSAERADSTSSTTLGPFRPFTYGVRLARDQGGVRLGLRLLYARCGLAARRGGIASVYFDDMQLVELTPELSVRVLRIGAGGSLRLEAGPALHVWVIEDLPARTRLAGSAAVAWDWPLADRFAGTLRAGGTLSASVWDPDDGLPAGFSRRATRRLGVALGVRYRL
ncbi:MAG: hypothetical protein ACREL9_08715 [Gemmatimonadales bacterium]